MLHSAVFDSVLCEWKLYCVKTMAENVIPMKWKRPESLEYPKVWHRFMARDLDSDDLVEYRIEDLVESRAEEAYQHMRDFYIADEPVSQVLGGDKDIHHFSDYVYGWKSIVAQKTPLVCYKTGSNDIVGLNFTFVTSKEDEFFEKLHKNSKSPVTNVLFGAAFLLYENFNSFEHYGVDKYLASLCLSVDRKYRGRAIGDHFMTTRKLLCKEYGLKLSHTIFTSDYSSRNAENAGFKSDVEMRFDDIAKLHPEYGLSNIKSTAISIKTLIC